jgi:hypothetical protein
MTQPDTSRRLSTRVVLRDIDALHGLQGIPNYLSPRLDASPEVLQRNYEDMLTKQQQEVASQNQAKAASDAARLAEWEFHKTILAMKESVRGQFGSDSDESQAIGYKKKSERKRPRRHQT